MDEQKIREIVRDEMNRNYKFGAPEVPPHNHDGVSNTKISLSTLAGVSPVPSAQIKYTNPDSTEEYGFGSDFLLSPASSGHLAQYVNDPAASIIPVPVIVGNGVGIQGSFQGGYAPDGTAVLFATGSATTSFLYLRFNGGWYQITVGSII